MLEGVAEVAARGMPDLPNPGRPRVGRWNPSASSGISPWNRGLADGNSCRSAHVDASGSQDGGGHDGRGDRVDPDLVGSQLKGEVARQRVQPALVRKKIAQSSSA